MKRVLLAAAALGAGLLGCQTPSPRKPEARRQLVDAVVENWSSVSRLNAAGLIERYGPPDRIESYRLVWSGKGPWKTLAVWDVAPYYDSQAGPDDLEGTVAYTVPASRRGALADFGKGLSVSRDGRELSARSSSEELNFLALNLADEIARGLKSPAAARDAYEAALRLRAAGKSSPYLGGLLFQPGPSGPGAP